MNYYICQKKGFVNYHPAPLPKYKGPNEIETAIKNKEIHWGVSVHYMDEDYDTGSIIEVFKFDLHEPPTAIAETWSSVTLLSFQII